MAENKSRTELAIIGAGPGGYAAAFLAADLGLEVTLIDPGENPGGVCLYRGCIPSKALLHVATLISETVEAKNWGVDFSRPRLDINRIRSWKNDVVEKLTAGLGGLAKRRKVNHIRGTASLIDKSSLKINKVDGNSERLSFDKAIIASGSRPAAIPGLVSDSPRMLDSTSALDLDDIPRSLLVVGGGYIGLELGTVYAALGSKVTVVEMMPGLLPGADRDLVSILNKRIENTFDDIMVNTKVESIKEQKNGIKVTFESSESDQGNRIFEKVLVAVGRKPNTENIGLDKAGIELDDSGFIKTDIQRRTSAPNIFAIGDVAGEPMLAHKATHEGRVAAEVIAGKKAAFEPYAIPAVIFTDPEIAWCGLTQTEAEKKGIEIEVSRFPWAASGRALTLGTTSGVTKLIIEPESERVLGVGIAGPGAGELIAEGVLAVEMAAAVSDLSLSIHPHPTLSETIMEAADAFLGQSTHYFRPKRKKV